jgi:hypothetical protein
MGDDGQLAGERDQRLRMIEAVLRRILGGLSFRRVN